jgi:signal peptidase I
MVDGGWLMVNNGTAFSGDTPRSRWRKRLALGVLTCAAVLAFATVISYATTLRAFAVPTASMMPTIKPGDYVGVEKDPRAHPERGEIWVFAMPPAAGLRGAVGVKRVMGLPGETIAVVAGRLFINGRAIDEPYVKLPFTYSYPARTLGADEYFALGDNRDKSFDSHSWGPLARGYLIGRALGRYWPPRRIGGL